MEESEYKILVVSQIEHITSMIGKDGEGDLTDLDFNGEKIVSLLNRKYGIKISISREHPDYHKILLTNWIYSHYYQNSGAPAVLPRSEQRHFPFDELFQQGTDGYWRNRFWRYDMRDQEREKPALTRGYETLIAGLSQSVEDDIVFESRTTPTGDLQFEEVQYLSICLPKFEIDKGYKYVNGKYPLDNAGLASIVRLYFKLKVDTLTVSIPFLISKISDLFNDRLVPFRLKFSFSNEEFRRSDHFVLYIERRHFSIAATLIRSLYREVEPFLEERLPYFVREVLPGIGFGSTPNKESSSFGVYRSAIIAGAIIFLLDGKNGDPVSIYLDRIWGGLEKFYLNPESPFSCDFSVFHNERGDLFTVTLSNQWLMAAWYIARLLCREAIWVSKSECNWMSYDMLGTSQHGYRFMKVHNGYAGLMGVITFLQAFQLLKIRDATLELVLEGAKRYCIARNNNFPPLRDIEPASREIIIPPQVFAKDMIKVVHSAIQTKHLGSVNDYKPIADMIKDYIQKERPVGNMLDGSDHFCADMYFGYASYGYACLRLHNPISVVELQL